MNDELDIFSTRDLHFASFLKLKGAVLKQLERKPVEYKERMPVYFVFEDRKKCEELEALFWGGVGEGVMINVKDYVAVIRDLRARTSSVNRVVDKTKYDNGNG